MWLFTGGWRPKRMWGFWSTGTRLDKKDKKMVAMVDGMQRRTVPLRCRVMAGSAKTLTLIALLTLSLSNTYAASPRVFSNSDIMGILMLGASVHAVALLVLIGLPPRLVNVLLAIFAGLGVASAHAVHTSLFLTNPVLLWCLLGAGGFALFVAFGAMDRSPNVGLALASLGALVTAMFATEHLFARNIPAASVDPAAVDMSNFRNVTFEQRPNLYFVSFDALVPRTLLRKYMDVETTPFHDIFQPRFRRFENFFANTLYTRHSLQTILALDERWYNFNHWKNSTGKDLELFSGGYPAPLFRILRDNGYETHTAYASKYLGKTKGPFVDHYFTANASTICQLLDERVRAVSFWGYCSWSEQHEPDRYMEVMNLRVFDYLRTVTLRSKPQFVMAHFYTPGHTDAYYRHDNENHFRHNRSRYLYAIVEAAHLLALLIDHVDQNDPQAILLVYGDHGLFLSRSEVFADAPEFVVQDHYGILGGIHPRDACAQWIDQAQEQLGYLTVLDAVHAVLRCLSGGESVLRATPKEHSMVGDWQRVVPDGYRRTYTEFLYE